MSFTSTKDFLALLRTTPDGTVRLASIPGLDWLLAALARAEVVSLWVNADSGPTLNQSTTVWLKTSSSSWTAEGSVYLWNTDTQSYQPATPTLWARLFQSSFSLNNEVDPVGSTTLTAQQTGLLFTNTSAPVVLYQLPPAAQAPSVVYEFLLTVPGSINVLVKDSGTPAADTINFGLNTSFIGAISAYKGSYLKIRSVNGQWFVTGAEGAWTLS